MSSSFLQPMVLMACFSHYARKEAMGQGQSKMKSHSGHFLKPPQYLCGARHFITKVTFCVVMLTMRSGRALFITTSNIAAVLETLNDVPF